MLLVEIAQYLHNRGLVNFDETGVSGDCFISVLPSSPDEVVALYPSGGIEADGKLGYDSPGVQILIRGSQNPISALSRAQSIYDALHGFGSGTFVPGGTWIVSCFCAQSGPVYLDRDQNERPEYILNFDLEIRNQNEYRE